MKIYLESKSEPWITWDSDLWKADKKHKHITSVQNDADWKVIEWQPNVIQCEMGNRLAFYTESIGDHDLTGFGIATNTMIPKPMILSDSVDILERCKKMDIQAFRWNKPTRVPERMHYKGNLKTGNKTGGFVITCNAERYTDNLAEIVKTYFAMCLQDDKTNEGELCLMHDVDIFSAQELPFEPFNNIHFHGLQPNPSMFKTIKNSKLFISPYKGDGVPINAIDAIMLGTPVLVRDTKVNRSIFNWNDRCFFKDEKELAKKIKFFSDISTIDKEYVRIVQDGFEAVSKTHSVSNSLNNLIYILGGN